MNQYTFNELKIGQSVCFDYDINKEKLNDFKEITGDINPLHNDINFAHSKGYEDIVVYGMLTSACLSTLAGVYLPGENSLIHSVEIKFLHPVFLNYCPLRVEAEIIEKDDRFNQIVVKYKIINNKNIKVCTGKMNIGVIK